MTIKNNNQECVHKNLYWCDCSKILSGKVVIRKNGKVIRIEDEVDPFSEEQIAKNTKEHKERSMKKIAEQMYDYFQENKELFEEEDDDYYSKII